jgi:hypothetical protein
MPHQNKASLQNLLSVASTGLVPMYDDEKNLFCSRMVRTQQGMQREGISHRYTLITLMGLYKLHDAGQPVPIPLDASLDALLRQTNWVQSAGDLGLLLWLCGLAAPERIDEFFRTHDLKDAIEKFPDASQCKTMELSWILSGLAHAALARPELAQQLYDLAQKIFNLLKENRGAHGIFGHQAQVGGVKGVLRGRLGSFADQVYPIYAFAWASKAFEWSEALDHSRSCADAICRAQGSMGQWWWHYDSKTGQPVGKYPVYSVHQHGMAPMALFALHDVAKMDYQKQIYLGLEWIYGQNELNVDMRDAANNVVWRCIRPTKARRYVDQALSMLNLQSEEPPRNLRILHECWPYELGWLLFAFAGRQIE